MFNIRKYIDDNKQEKLIEHQREVEDRIILADQVRNFFNGDIGKFLLKRMEEDIQAIKNKLVLVDATDIKQVQKLQNSFEVVNKIKGYFAYALLVGDNALQSTDLTQYQKSNYFNEE